MAGDGSRSGCSRLGEARRGSAPKRPGGLHPSQANPAPAPRQPPFARLRTGPRPGKGWAGLPPGRRRVAAMAIFTEWVRRCTRCPTVDERAAWRDPATAQSDS